MAVLAGLRSFAVFNHLAGQWWREPVDYWAQVQFFSRRALADAIKILIGAGTGLVAVIALVILFPAAGTGLTLSRLVIGAFSAVTLFWSLLWCWRPWPSRATSSAFTVTSDIGIAAVALMKANWLTGLFGLNAFALISVYLLFFGGPKALALHTTWILSTTLLFVLLAGSVGPLDQALLGVKIFGAVAPIVATPLGIQFGIWVLRNDANKSVTDPLTGLLNRRGLHLHFAAALRADLPPDTAVVVIVVDLDRFKDINDTYGHAAGDAVLVRCARQIKSAVHRSTLVARTGGEEFVAVAVGPRSLRRLDHKPEKIRAAIAAPVEYPVTASIGVSRTSIRPFAVVGADHEALLDDLIDRADHAMFHAKRNGGNMAVGPI